MRQYNNIVDGIESESIRTPLSEIFPKLSEKRRQLVSAINQDNFDMVKAVIESISEDDVYFVINFSYEQHLNLLFKATEKDNEEIVRYLIEKGADTNTYGEYGYNLLTFAVNNGSKSIVKFLINECNFDINSADKSRDTPLNVAVENKNQSMVKFLVNECNANVNQIDQTGSTPLILAVVDDNKQMVRCLVKECNADVNLQDIKGNTPLTFAVLNNNESIAEFLIDNGADINKQNKKGSSPMDCAIRSGNSSMLKILVEMSRKQEQEEEREQISKKKKEGQPISSNVTSKKKKKKKKKKKAAKQLSVNAAADDQTIQKAEETPIKSNAETENIPSFIYHRRRSSISNGLLPHIDFNEVVSVKINRRYSISNGMLSFENDIFDDKR
jgi:ankyrin repeat protein